MMRGGEPFFFRAGSTALLLIHGFSSTPQEIRELGEYLAQEDITVRAPLLKGHGTKPDDLADVHWQDWVKQLENEFLVLKKEYPIVWVGGSSLGGNLALHLASHLPVSGVLALATPIHLRFERLIAPSFRIMGFFKKSFRKHYPPHVDRKLIDKKVHYWSYPISSLGEAYRCIKETVPLLSRITAPALIMQSETDHMLSRKNAECIYETIGSREKRLVWVPNSYHVFTIDHWKEEAFREIAGFIKAHTE